MNYMPKHERRNHKREQLIETLQIVGFILLGSTAIVITAKLGEWLISML